MSKVVMGLICTAVILSLLPFALIARSRASKSPKQPIHLILDMDKQPKYKPQFPSAVFADGRAMRPQVAGTVAMEDMGVSGQILDDASNPHLVNGSEGMMVKDPTQEAAVMMGRIRPAGMTDADFNGLQPPMNDDAKIAADKTFYVATIPAEFPVTKEFLERGQERFNIYCAPCHGTSGYGDGMVAKRAFDLQHGPNPSLASAWIQPQNLNDPKIGTRPDGHIFNTITNGIRSMPPYDKQITVPDRWAIVAYVRALEKSQSAAPGDLSADEAAKLKR